MRTLLKYFGDYKKECVFGPLFKILEASFELLVPLVVVRIIDIGIANNDTSYILRMCLVMVALGVIGLTCTLFAQYFSAKAAVGFASKVRMALFSHIQHLSYKSIDRLGTSSMITRMTSDINQLQNGVNMTLRLFLRSPFIVFGAAIMSYTIDIKSTLIFIVVIVLLSIVVYGIMLITIPLFKNVQALLDKVLEKTRDNIGGVRVIRAFGLESKQQKEFYSQNDKYVKAEVFAGRISALTNPFTFAIVNIGTAYLIYKGAVRVEQSYITQGQLVALVNYMSQILIELVKLANFIVLDIKALACADRIATVLKDSDKREITVDEDIHSDSYIEFKDVCLRYEQDALDSLIDISFTVKKGETIGVIGGTGSGKTSLINMIPGFYEKRSGEIFIKGRKIGSYRDDELTSMTGLVPQKALLFQGSIRDNMLWGNKNASDDEIIDALKIAQAYDFVSEKEGQLDYMLTGGGKNLSGGQRQRLTIARALVKKPEILILDDSSSALDAVTDRKLREAIQNLQKDMTVFIVSQRTASIMNADKILVLDEGKLVGVGTHEELLNSSQTYREIYESQFFEAKK